MYLITGPLGLGLIASSLLGGGSGDAVSFWGNIFSGVAVVLASAYWSMAEDKEFGSYWVLVAGWAATLGPMGMGLEAGKTAMQTGLLLGGAVSLLVSFWISFGPILLAGSETARQVQGRARSADRLEGDARPRITASRTA